MDNPKKPNKKLQHQRELLAWTQQQLADEIGTDVKRVSMWECGDCVPGRYYQKKLCSIFGKNPAELNFIDDLVSIEASSVHQETDIETPGTLLDYAQDAENDDPNSYQETQIRGSYGLITIRQQTPISIGTPSFSPSIHIVFSDPSERTNTLDTLYENKEASVHQNISILVNSSLKENGIIDGREDLLQEHPVKVSATSENEEIPQQDIERDNVDRREATQRILEAIIGGSLLMTPYDLLRPQAMERLSSALLRPSNMNEETLRQFENINESCWHLMMEGELEIAERTLWGYLPKLIVLAKQPSEHQRIAARIASQGYLLAASLAGHHDDLLARERYCEQALSFGYLAQDRNLQVSALKQLALTYEYKNRPALVLQTYQKAVPYLKEVSPLLRSRMYAGLAGAHAQCGQKQGGQKDAALDSLALAYNSFPEKPGEDPSFLYADCDYFTIILWDGLVYLDLDQPEGAEKAFARVDGLHPKIKLPEKVRIEFLNYQSEAFTKLGKLDPARTYLEEAVKASLALGSERRYNESFDVYQLMRIVWRNEPEVKKLGRLFIR